MGQEVIVMGKCPPRHGGGKHNMRVIGGGKTFDKVRCNKCGTVEKRGWTKKRGRFVERVRGPRRS